MELVSRVLLMPYIDHRFNDISKDIISKLVTGYHKLCLENNQEEYRKAVRAMECYRFDDVKINSLDDMKMLIEIFYPMAEMSYLYGKDPNAVNEYYINRIFQIASNFITFRDGRVAIRLTPDSKENDVFSGYRTMNKIELWNTISRIVPTDVFIAAHFINAGICSEDDMRLYFVNVPILVEMSDKLLKGILRKGIAENHLHANAGISYLISWTRALKWNNISKSGVLYCRETFFRLAFAEYIEKYSKSNEFVKYLEDNGDDKERPDEHILAKVYFEICRNVEYDTKEIYDNILLKYAHELEKYFASFNTEEYSAYSMVDDDLKKTIYKQYNNMGTDTELIFLYKSLLYLRGRGKKDTFAKGKFLQYLRKKNDFYKDKLQSNKVQGFEYFSKYYAKATRLGMSRQNTYSLIFSEQCKNDVLKKLELRLTPRVLPSLLNGTYYENEIEMSIIKDVSDMLSAYIKVMKFVSKDSSKEPANIGIVYHFRKVNGEDNFSGRQCILKKQTIVDDRGNDYYEMREVYSSFVRILNKALIKNPILAKYIVGLDAASTENATEPWVLAPVFRDSRIREETRPVEPESRKYVRNIGLTYHVGEDFRHIMSGLRHIDEVIENFGYMPGDRIGHAVALGVNVRELIGINKIVCMPIIEYFDNLIWLWGTAHDVGFDTDYDANNIEYKILNTAREIYGDDLRNIDVFMLREAYEKKFYYLNEKQKQIIKDSMDTIHENSSCGKRFCMLDRFHNGHWDADKLVCTYYCPCYNRIYNRPIFVELSEKEAIIIEQLQKYIIRKIERKGIYVETNPTSNTAITDVSSIMDHPILKLNNLGLDGNDSHTNSVMVTINSDDATVFSTNVENELSMIYHSLIYHGYSREKVLNWMDKIRKNGMASSFVNETGSMDNIRSDYEALKKILNGSWDE